MAVRNGEGLPPRALWVAVYFLAALVAVSTWDAEEFDRMAEEAKGQAVRMAVESSLERRHFASDFHCRVPIRGERLVMQHASAHDAGRGYRCTYYLVMEPLHRKSYTTVTWSRSPGAVEIEERTR